MVVVSCTSSQTLDYFQQTHVAWLLYRYSVIRQTITTVSSPYYQQAPLAVDQCYINTTHWKLRFINENLLVSHSYGAPFTFHLWWEKPVRRRSVTYNWTTWIFISCIAQWEARFESHCPRPNHRSQHTVHQIWLSLTFSLCFVLSKQTELVSCYGFSKFIMFPCLTSVWYFRPLFLFFWFVCFTAAARGWAVPMGWGRLSNLWRQQLRGHLGGNLMDHTNVTCHCSLSTSAMQSTSTPAFFPKSFICEISCLLTFCPYSITWQKVLNLWQGELTLCVKILFHANIQAKEAALVRNYFFRRNNLRLPAPSAISWSNKQWWSL